MIILFLIHKSLVGYGTSFDYCDLASGGGDHINLSSRPLGTSFSRRR